MASDAESDSNRRVVLTLYEKFRAGDIDAIGAYLHEDIDWCIEVSRDYFPSGGTRRGRGEVVAALKDLTARFEHLHYDTQFTIVEGDRACVFSRARLRDRESGRETEADLCDLIRLRDGKVVWYRELFDTLSAAEAMLGGQARFA